ncbi:putative ubiquitin-protein ligase protein [Phaeoacremonium minimum UCRPA7]|uniref:Putative ubiquitin-protein ligase protein n=1 Tax=Phaeoacremonium minimum (strain UCR-PA7) TaxID=1286976 RepID=R8BWY5_PHAM7|nr:putative ubiquitin-protein ligase protein [Phaeoacremonium minimum UCRPA7]EOO03886.1 putative ubiquitin-protein ligase protein [Phaeoacremonium minimum UCRPA7]
MEGAVVVPSPAAAFNNATMWNNFTVWTTQHLGVNMTKFAPSFEDLVWAGPRMVMKLGKLGSFISFPDAIDGFGQRVIPDATGANHVFSAGAPAASSFVTNNAPAAVESLAADQDPAAIVSRFSMEGARGLGSVFSYATSKWALCCIAMAVVLNRTHIFAATRRRLRLRLPVRFLLRIVPIVLFVLQARSLLQSIQCQTSPDFSELRWGNASKKSDLMFAHKNALLHGLSSTLLFGASDEESCLAVRMIPPDDRANPELRGSLSLLWPLFGTFCMSQFLETVSCAVQGRPVAAETGMTLFEHSLAFAEADAAVSNQLGWGLFSPSAGNSTSQANIGTNIAISRAMILKRVNTPPEVLLVAFLSTMSHISSHVLGVFGLQSKFRLISTGFWALCFMASIIWYTITFSLEDPAGQGLLRFPTVCIIGFIPHVLVLAGIFICSSIYSLALLLSAAATPRTAGDGSRLTFKERLLRAHHNMQANVSLSDLRITMEMDFYTALLRAGFGAITMASEAVYLNEDRQVNLKRFTWLEEERFREIEDLKMQWSGTGVPGSRYDSIGAIGLVPVKEGQVGASSGYSRERAAQKVSKSRAGERRPVRDGVGAAERSGRWLMAMEYMMHINKLVLTAWAIAACRFLAALGMQNPPSWLKWLSSRPKAGRPEEKRPAEEQAHEWLAARDGVIQIPRNDGVDVEYELRRRIPNTEGHHWQNDIPREQEVDNKLYSWWLKGGWWGTTDTSGDYEPTVVEDPDFDATSVISTTETDISADFGSEADWESDDGNNDGVRTPTQRSPFASRESTPMMDHPMQMTDLARLLHPRSPAEREEARALAAHFGNEGIMTRSSYRRFEQRQRSQLLFSNHQFRAPAKMTPDEEAEVLEQILVSRRAAGAVTAGAAASNMAESSWATGAAGLGPDGPQCVICQSTPRTIIVWPCRCLSLCDDCRVSLAMNNFDKCVCCRREVISFSRIYVP